MRRARRTIAWGCLVLLTLLAAPTTGAAEDDAPTLESVKAALLDFLPGAEGDRGRAQIAAWGNRALPHLMDIAFRSTDRRMSHHMADAVRTVGTKEAADLFVLILENKTRIEGLHALTELFPYELHLDFFAHLRAHTRFKQAVLAYAKGVFRGRVADACAAFGWKDQAPLLKKLLKDRDLDVREAAAAALRRLTGERVEVGRPKDSFPSERLVKGLLHAPEGLPQQDGRRGPDLALAARWLDGTPRLVCGWEDGIASLGQRAELRARTGLGGDVALWPLLLEVEHLAIVPDGAGARQIIAIVSEEKDGRFKRNAVIAWTAEGARRWRREFETLYLKDLAILHGEKGPVGVVLGAGGDDGLVAMDLDGKTRWQIPKTYTTYGVSTHPALPDFVLHVGSDYELYRHAGDKARLALASRRSGLFVTHGVLFPDAGGKPALVVAGEVQDGDVPTLMRVDATGKPVWQASLSHDVEALTLLEPRQGPRLLVATTEAGELLVLDADGALRWRAPMPEVEAGERNATYQLEAGEIADGEYAVLVRLLGRGYAYRLNAEALASKR